MLFRRLFIMLIKVDCFLDAKLLIISVYA